VSSSLEAIVKHGGRLDVLCCLIDAEPQAVTQLSAKIGKPRAAVSYWVKLLEAFGLVEKAGDLGDGKPLYAARLDGHPDWVREAVEEHRRD
jgi:DNA-binding transcriptional ArsR family regulator